MTRILLIEDHIDSARVFSRVLTQRGYAVHVASLASDAITITEQSNFDLFIIDLGLPDQWGADLLQELRRRGYTAPAIAFSAHGMRETIVQCEEAGFAAFLVKPINTERFLRVVGAVSGSM